MAKEVSEAEFEQEVLQAQSVVVDFWAPWCGPCQMQAPILEDLAKEMPSVSVCKVNVDSAPGVAAKYQVQSIPTLIFFSQGKETDRAVGVQTLAKLKEMASKAGE